ncbi:MAG TPA: glycosyltransferase family 39 protein [Ktedonobacterales bacterium]|nr:glycosyltransferase family 39 protein [Ktedonobacterales bacterium]
MRGGHQAAVAPDSSKTMESPAEHARALFSYLARMSWLISAAIWRVCVPVMLFVVAFIPRWSLAHTLDLVTDESTYIRIGRLDYTLLTTGHLTNPKWMINFEAPSLPKLLMGFGSLWAQQNRSPGDWLIGARIPGVILGALFIVLIYWLSRPIFGKLPALFGALALALSPWVAYFSAIAYLDSYLLGFVTLAILLTWHAARHPWLFVLVGVLLGLAFDSKYTAAFAVLPIGAYLAYYYAFRVHRRPPRQIWLIPLMTLLAIYVADPAVWASPLDRLWDGIAFQWNHAARGHSVYLNGRVWDHVPPGEVVFILVAKMSLFICIPALLALPWALVRIIRARGAPNGRDERAAFAFFWLFGMLIPFGMLNIVVGTHYMLPLAPAVTCIGAWALLGACRWLGPRLITWGERSVAAIRARTGSVVAGASRTAEAAPRWPAGLRAFFTQTRARRLAAFALLLAACLAMTIPPLNGLLTVSQAEGYTSEWLDGENSSLQVAYPGYADGTQWVTDHTEGWVTVSLIGTPGSMDYWMMTRQYLYPERIRLDISNVILGEQYQPPSVPRGRPHYLIWPAHLIQREFPTLPNWRSKVVATIKGGSTIYCYIIRVQ